MPTDEQLAGRLLAPVLVAVVGLEALREDPRQPLRDHHVFADGRQVPGNRRHQRRGPGIRGQEHHAGLHGAVRGLDPPNPPASRHHALDTNPADRARSLAVRGFQQAVHQLEGVELPVARRPLRATHGSEVECGSHRTQVVGRQHLDGQALRSLGLGHHKGIGLLAFVREQVERAAALPFDAARQLGLERLEQIERAAGVVRDGVAGAGADQGVHAREVPTYSRQRESAEPARGTRRGSIGLDDEWAHARSCEVVGRPGADESGADHDHLGTLGKVGSRIRLERHELRDGEERHLARTTRRRYYGHPGPRVCMGGRVYPRGVSQPEPIRFRAGNLTLSGELLLPDQASGSPGSGRRETPWVLLLPSWLPRDRDGAFDDGAHPAWFGHGPMAPHRPGLLRRLAEALAELGAASFRYDPRGCGESDGDWAASDLFTRIDDARDALGAMRSRGELDLARTGIVGHGEGAAMALSVAIADPAIGALTLIGAPARSLRHLLRCGAAARSRGGTDRHHPLVEALDRWSEELIERTERREGELRLRLRGPAS